MKEPKIILADGNELVRTGFSAVIQQKTKAVIIAECSSEKELLAFLKTDAPDLLVIDYTTEGFTVDTISKAKKLHPKLNILAVTYQQTGLVIIDALKAGVRSYVKKDCSIQEIMDAIEETSDGSKFFCGKILEKIREESIDVEDLTNQEYTCDPIALSSRELEIMTLIAEGYKNTVIAEKLFISAHTVNTHRKNILSKLGINNTAGIVMYAVKAGLVAPKEYLFAVEEG